MGLPALAAAQFRAQGLTIDYLDVHMGAAAPKAYTEVADKLGELYPYSDVAKARGLTSVDSLSERERRDKKPWLLNYLSTLDPGLHVLVVHPAVAGAEIASLTGPTSVPYRWAEEFRIADLELLTDPEVAELIRGRGIELTSIGATIARR